jgi:hypothetical protein
VLVLDRGIEAFEAQGGTLYVVDSERTGSLELWRLPTEGGSPVGIFMGLRNKELRGDLRGAPDPQDWTLTNSLFYALISPETNDRLVLQSYDLLSGKTEIWTEFTPQNRPKHIDISPDGGFVLYDSVASRNSDLYLLEPVR